MNKTDFSLEGNLGVGLDEKAFLLQNGLQTVTFADILEYVI